VWGKDKDRYGKNNKEKKLVDNEFKLCNDWVDHFCEIVSLLHLQIKESTLI